MNHRLIYETLSELARRVEALDGKNASSDPADNEEPLEPFDLLELDKQVKRLSREVYKANMLNQTQADQAKQAIESAQQALAELNREREKITQAGRLDLIKALLPVVDGIESGITSGAMQIKMLMTAAPAAAQTLIAWLNGQRLLRERLLKLLESEGVQSMVVVGQPFDPYKHVAVKTVEEPGKADGVILAEERRGYVHGDDVLRYADVIVNRARPAAASS